MSSACFSHEAAAAAAAVLGEAAAGAGEAGLRL